MKPISAITFIFIFLLSLSSFGQNSGSKKIIATGWDMVDQKMLKKNISQIEKCPFNGIVVNVVGKYPCGSPLALRNTLMGQKWKREWFKEALADLKSVKFKRFTDNFAMIGANPGNVDWFNDKGWEAVIEHWKIAAWIAKEAGFKGILFDPEAYTKPYLQFGYTAQPEMSKHTFKEYYQKARERGRQVIKAVAEEYPDLTIFTFFMNSINFRGANSPTPQAIMAYRDYGLLPAFIDGWLDVAPSSMTFVDGCEHAYRYNCAKQYTTAATKIKGACQYLVSPENRAKYRSQVQVSYGVYLDAYWIKPGNVWSIKFGKNKPVEQLFKNMKKALEFSDKYVWVYGERFRWWPTHNKRVKPQSWTQALPNCDTAIFLAQNPLKCAEKLIKKAAHNAKLKNIARNGNFNLASAKHNNGKQVDWKTGSAPAGWSYWQQSRKHKGEFTWNRKLGVAEIKGVPINGCLIQRYPVKPGETYAIMAKVKAIGASKVNITVRWQDRRGYWTKPELDVFAMPSKADKNDWRKLYTVATVPEDVGYILVLLCAGNQKDAKDIAYFDDVKVYQIAKDIFKATPKRFTK